MSIKAQPHPTTRRRAAAGFVLVTSCAALVATTTTPALAAAVSYKNCTELHKSYPHGLGRANAKDKTSGKPVTSFKKDTRAYNLAMSKNRDLDRDRDGIACEKR
jgi:hypothetical protein